MSDRFTEKAEKILHDWAQLPGYEPLDEDMAINLVCRIRDTLKEEAQDGIERPSGFWGRAAAKYLKENDGLCAQNAQLVSVLEMLASGAFYGNVQDLARQAVESVRVDTHGKSGAW